MRDFYTLESFIYELTDRLWADRGANPVLLLRFCVGRNPRHSIYQVFPPYTWHICWGIWRLRDIHLIFCDQCTPGLACIRPCLDWDVYSSFANAIADGVVLL